MLVLLARVAAADERASFALILGVNKSVDPALPSLRYADDDAARYHELFRALGARTYLLTRADDNTRRLHPQAVAEAEEPREAGFARVVAQLTADVAQARARKIGTTLYIVYAGHGDERDGEGFISLEDGRLTGRRLAKEVLERVRADESHLIIDACYSYFLVFGRGPGGARRPLRGFATLDPVLARDVGLLFSTSSARESHEWDAYEAGVFSHEVRSGLSGAADLDRDGRVSYREIAAFIERANAAIASERYRPDVYARPPPGGELFVDLRPGLQRRLELDGKQHGHLILEDGRGVRVADFHNPPGQALHLLRPPSLRGFFLRRSNALEEIEIPPAPDVIELAALEWRGGEVAMRGAAHEQFRTLFAQPFDRSCVDGYQFREIRAPKVWLGRTPAAQRRLVAGSVITALAAGVLAGGLALTLVASDVRDDAPAGEPQIDTAARNDRIGDLNAGAGALYGIGAAALVGGVLLLALPQERERARIALGPHGIGVRF